jgi:hypothetical protein
MITNYCVFLRNTFLFSVLTVCAFCSEAAASSLVTKSFLIDITSNCEEGNVVCNNITYRSIDRKTGKTLQLKGKTVHSLCADQVTPCRFLGYEFLDLRYEDLGTSVGDYPLIPYRYFISGDTLEIYRYRQLITSEKGTWQY